MNYTLDRPNLGLVDYTQFPVVREVCGPDMSAHSSALVAR